MSLSLLRKTFNDARWLLLACAGVMFAFSWIRVIIVASFELHQIQRLARNLPDLIQRLSPVPLDRMVSYPGLISFTYEEPLAYLIMAVWTVARGSDCVSGEIGRGTMEMLLAQPVSRLRYLTTHTLVTAVGIVVIAVCAHAGTRVGIETAKVKLPAPGRQFTVPFFGTKVDIPPAEMQKQEQKQFQYRPISGYVKNVPFWVASANYACLGVFLLGLSTAMSSWDRYRWRTIGIVVGFYVIENVIELTGMAVEGYHWLLHLTFFSAFEPVAFVIQATRDSEASWMFWAKESAGPIPDLGPMGCNIVLLAFGVMGICIAAAVFSRRDIPAPL